MKIWAIGDLHLNISVPEKSMEIFSDCWKDYVNKIAKEWKALIKKEDLVLLCGDLCWAIRLSDAVQELEWLDSLPGTKVMIKGNHDFWWSSLKKVKEALPPSVHIIQNNAFHLSDIAVAGSRLWDTQEYSFEDLIEYQENPQENVEAKVQEDLSEKIFTRELQRLQLSLDCMDPKAKIKIAMTHYPPISWDLKPSKTASLLERYKIQYCIFGHLHNVKKDRPIFGKKNGVQYILTSSDYLDFKPVEII